MMNRGERLVKAAMALATAGILVCAGCGFKDDPVPPQHVLPQAVPDLRVELIDQGATLSWSYPRKTVTGDEIEEIEGFELFQAEIPEKEFCPSCPIPYRTAIDVPGGFVAPGIGKTAIYEVRDLRPGNLYYFKVRSKSGWWRKSKDSNEVSFLWQTPPMAPQGLSVLSGDGVNTLQWQPVTLLKDGVATTAPIRYQLYRGVDGGAVTTYGAPVTATTFGDKTVVNGKSYAYQVQAESTYSHGTANSALSESVVANPTDRTPPPVPLRVEALRTEIGIKVFWDDAAAEDLAGYRIYRRVAGMEPVLVGEVNLPYTLFIDKNAPRGDVLYSVSSIDTRNPANESGRSVEVRPE
ncbi:MAG: hypothetical protein PHI97_07895 [Desulfobulbus sp.]|nr:hypothetical protein [Desulfobulbus sp.]